MKFSDWFDPYNIEHIRAYCYLHEKAYWPEGFKPKHVKTDIYWEANIKTKIINAWINEASLGHIMGIPAIQCDKGENKQ